MPIRVSVVVPTYKRTDLLSRTLAALTEQDYSPTEYQVVVSDDSASAETQYLVESWAEQAQAEREGPQICYVPVHGNHGPAAARNRGWQAALGEIIAFTDDDCIPAPDWLRAGVGALTGPIVAASGQVVVPLPDRPTDYERNAAGLETAEFLTANCFIRCEALVTVGGFDERFTLAWREDSDLFMSLLERGYAIGFAPEAVVVHPVRPAPWGISIKQQQRNLFNSLLYKKHSALYPRWIQMSPRRRYYSIVGALTLALVSAVQGPRLLTLGALGYWGWQTGRFARQRLRTTVHRPGHIAEMLITSALIPPLAVYWRLKGALKWRVMYW